MTGLRELQTAFGANLLDAEETGVLPVVHGGRFVPAQRLQIYRNNVFTSFTEALRSVYPVVEKLVGEGFFLYACNQYIRDCPSTSGDLHRYGADFGDFLASFEPAATLPYLADVARLEWFYHAVYHEADSPGLDLAALSTVAPEQYAGLRFSLHPARRLLRSAFPVIEVWRVNQDDFDGDQSVDLDSGGVCALVSRSGEEIELRPLGAGDYEALLAIQQGEPLEACVDKALAVDEQFDFDSFLRRYVQDATLAGFTIDKSE